MLPEKKESGRQSFFVFLKSVEIAKIYARDFRVKCWSAKIEIFNWQSHQEVLCPILRFLFDRSPMLFCLFLTRDVDYWRIE